MNKAYENFENSDSGDDFSSEDETVPRICPCECEKDLPSSDEEDDRFRDKSKFASVVFKRRRELFHTFFFDFRSGVSFV